MTEHLTFVLEKEAKHKGADRYKCTTNEDFVIYIPQYISRKSDHLNNTVIKQEIRISIT
jgi:hypothetical protein